MAPEYIYDQLHIRNYISALLAGNWNTNLSLKVLNKKFDG